MKVDYLEKTKKALIISESKLKECKKYSDLWNFTKRHVDYLRSEIERLT